MAATGACTTPLPRNSLRFDPATTRRSTTMPSDCLTNCQAPSLLGVSARATSGVDEAITIAVKSCVERFISSLLLGFRLRRLRCGQLRDEAAARDAEHRARQAVGPARRDQAHQGDEQAGEARRDVAGARASRRR